MPRDDFAGQHQGINGNSEEWAVITPHDTTPLARRPRFIANGSDTDGVVRFAGSDGVFVTQFLNKGQPFPARPHIVHTDTDIDPLIAYY